MRTLLNRLLELRSAIDTATAHRDSLERLAPDVPVDSAERTAFADSFLQAHQQVTKARIEYQNLYAQIDWVGETFKLIQDLDAAPTIVEAREIINR